MTKIEETNATSCYELEFPDVLDLSQILQHKGQTLILEVNIPGADLENNIFALMDTGANVSTITIICYRTLLDGMCPLTQAKFQGVKGFGKNIVPILGCCAMPLKIN